jgi:hypothetical protein
MKKGIIRNTISTIILSGSLLFQAGFAVHAATCDTSSNIWQLKDKSFSDLAGCATPEAVASVTTAKSPYQIISLIITFTGGLAISLSILGIIIGIIYAVTSAGNKTKFTSATNTIKNSIIALIITVTATLILNLLLNQFGFNGSSSSSTGSGGSSGSQSNRY